ncbi:type II toxin-antitoxin system prevent-host-death family antitoxin [Rhodococcus sp. WS4]|nr:type II toxin-antitoxin system prevent-host-death family antitoxin [Rhodococcus sp. WS4]
MESLGLKELRQHASDYVKRAEAGETMLITVAGRPSAILGPAGRKTWCAFDEVADVFRTDTDPTWEADRGLIDDPIADPWAPR